MTERAQAISSACISHSLHGRQTSEQAFLDALRHNGFDVVPFGEAERLRQALVDIQHPVAALERLAKAEGGRINGTAHAVANTTIFLQEIARKAYPAPKP